MNILNLIRNSFAAWILFISTGVWDVRWAVFCLLVLFIRIYPLNPISETITR